MKLALQLRLIPLDKTIDAVKWAKDHGVEGIELGTAQPDALRKTTAEIKGVLPIVSVCGNCSIDAPWSFDFLDPDPAKRKKSIDGAKATVHAYCDPASSKACTRADVLKYGGNLQVTLPAATGLRPTTVWIETFSAKNISAQQLVRIARSLKAIQ